MKWKLMMESSSYKLRAALLGLLWFVALWIWPSTHWYVAGASWQNFEVRALEQLALCCTSSLILARLFRPWILAADSPGRRARLAFWIPLAGTLVFVWSVLLFGAAMGALVGPEGGRTGEFQTIGEGLVFAGVQAGYGLLYALAAIPVTFPLGLLSTRVLQSISSAGSPAVSA